MRTGCEFVTVPHRETPPPPTATYLSISPLRIYTCVSLVDRSLNIIPASNRDGDSSSPYTPPVVTLSSTPVHRVYHRLSYATRSLRCDSSAPLRRYVTAPRVLRTLFPFPLHVTLSRLSTVLHILLSPFLFLLMLGLTFPFNMA